MNLRRLASLFGFVAAAACTSDGDEPIRVSECECKFPGLVADAPGGADFSVDEAACGGTCDRSSEGKCAGYRVTRATPGACTVRATPAGGEEVSLTIAFATAGGCCAGPHAAPSAWRVGP